MDVIINVKKNNKPLSERM